MKKFLGFSFPHWSVHLLPSPDIDNSLFYISPSAKYPPFLVLDFRVPNDTFIVARNKQRRKGSIKPMDVPTTFMLCYEAVRIIEQTPIGKTPILIFDPLESFYNESIEFKLRKLLLKELLFHLRRLSRGAELALIIPHPPPSYHAYCLLGHVVHSASRVVTYTTNPCDTRNMKLF
jgi:hypothetical protein